MNRSVSFIVLLFISVCYAVPVQRTSASENVRYGRQVLPGGLLGGFASGLTPGFGGLGGQGGYGGAEGFSTFSSYGYQEHEGYVQPDLPVIQPDLPVIQPDLPFIDPGFGF